MVGSCHSGCRAQGSHKLLHALLADLQQFDLVHAQVAVQFGTHHDCADATGYRFQYRGVTAFEATQHLESVLLAVTH